VDRWPLVAVWFCGEIYVVLPIQLLGSLAPVAVLQVFSVADPDLQIRGGGGGSKP